MISAVSSPTPRERVASGISLGVVGCGAAAERYYVPALSRHPLLVRDIRLVDSDLNRAFELSKSLGGGKPSDDYHRILNEVDGVIVTLPHLLHHRVAMDFLNAGVHVLCEKPLAENGNQVEEMNATADRNGVVLCVNNTRRMFPAARRIRDVIASGEIGHLRSIDYCEGSAFSWPSATGFYVDPRVSSKGVLLDIGAHVLDLVCWWLNERPRVVVYKDDSFDGPECVSLVDAESQKCTIRVFLNRLYTLDSRFRITGDCGAIQGRVSEWTKFEIVRESGTIVNEAECDAKNYAAFVLPIVDNFLRIVAGRGEAPLVSGRDVSDSIGLIDDCYRRRSRFSLSWYENLSDVVVR